MCSSWIFSVEASWVGFRLKPQWVPMLGGPKIEGSPQSQESKQAHESQEEKGDKESPKACTRLKSCEPLYTCRRPPFIGRQGDFYNPRLPSNRKNIPSMNMYMNVFYILWFEELISYILQASCLFTLKIRTFWDDIFDLVSRRPPKSYSWSSALVRANEPRFLELAEVCRFLSFPKFIGSYLPEFARFRYLAIHN
jgi:hypothetical protein